MKSIFKQAITIALLAIVIFAVPGGNAAVAAKSNCNSVKRTYPFGIALNKQSIGTSRAEVNRAKYIQFMYLDRDLDGIVCEIENLQTIVTSPVTSPVTTVPRTVVTLPPRPVFTTTTNPECPGLTRYECAKKLMGFPKIVIPTTTINPICIGLTWINCKILEQGGGPTIPGIVITTSTTTLPPTTTTTLPPTTTSSICIPDSYEVSRLNFAIQPWNNNYSVMRRLFIYEGRTDAVRMLDSYTQAMRDRYDSAMRSINSCVRVYWEITNWNSITWPNR